MSYIVISVYSFECERDGEDGHSCGCPEFTPGNHPGQLLQTAHRQLRDEGWVIRNVDGRWEHYCPRHNPQLAAQRSGKGSRK